jgi:hypothetical protein
MYRIRMIGYTLTRSLPDKSPSFVTFRASPPDNQLALRVSHTHMYLSLSLLPFALAIVSAIPLHNNATHTPTYKRQDPQTTIPSHIYRTRAQSAVNLGFWLVGERCKQISLRPGDDYLTSLPCQMVIRSTLNPVAPTRSRMTSLLWPNPAAKSSRRTFGIRQYCDLP